MKHMSKVLPLFIFPGLVFLVHITASKVFHLYAVFPHMDIPAHYLGGFSIAYTSGQLLSYLERQSVIIKLDPFIFLVLILSLTATAAVFWEFGEFALDQAMHTNIQISVANTMQDQFLGVLGGLTVLVIYYRRFFGNLSRTKS